MGLKVTLLRTETSQSLLKKYPSDDELEEFEERQEVRKHLALQEADVVKGVSVPYPLEELPEHSSRYLNWLSSLIDCYNFFSSTPEHPRKGSNSSPGNQSSHLLVMMKCFTSLDADGDNIISRADVTKIFGSEPLADVFLATFQPTADSYGVSWSEFNSRGSDPVGAAWEALLLEADTVDERIVRGVMLLQRLTASPWLEPDGKEKGHHRQPVMDDTTCGMGVLFLMDHTGVPVVSKVVRPGPADDILYAGDKIVSVNGIELAGMLPGKAIGTLCGLWGEVGAGTVKLGVQNDVGVDVEYRNVFRIPPPARQRPSVESLVHRDVPRGKMLKHQATLLVNPPHTSNLV